MTPHTERLLQRLSLKYSDHDTTNFNVLDYVSAMGSPLDARMYAKLFWPEFIEVHGMVFLQETLEDDADVAKLADALNSPGHDLSEIERSFNLVEVPSGLFAQSLAESTVEEDQLLARDPS